MTENDIRKRFYDIFPELTLVKGLSTMEAVGYGLIVEVGLTAEEASEFATDLMGKNVKPFYLENYVCRARKKLKGWGRGEFMLDGFRYQPSET